MNVVEALKTAESLETQMCTLGLSRSLFIAGLTDITTYIQSHLWLFLTIMVFGLKEVEHTYENSTHDTCIHIVSFDWLEMVYFAVFRVGLQEMKRPKFENVNCPAFQ